MSDLVRRAGPGRPARSGCGPRVRLDSVDAMGEISEQELHHPEGLLVRPEKPCGTGVLVLAGSSGRVDSGRAHLLARHGALAMAIRWFGGEGQQPGPWEVPLETFLDALDRLAPVCDRLVVTGVSFGAEAALLTAAHDDRVDAVVAFAPSPVVWAGVVEDGADGTTRQTSHWTLDGIPLPFVPFLESWEPAGTPPAFRDLYAKSLATFADEAAKAAIPVERIRGEVVVIGGEDDQVWPGADFARAVASRREQHGLPTTVVTHPEAGHRVVLPGEAAVSGGMAMARGGTPAADAELGALAWPAVATALRLEP